MSQSHTMKRVLSETGYHAQGEDDDEEERNIESEYSEHLPRWAIVPSYINTFKGPNVIQPQS
jgi:hypothetical protein